MNVLPVETTMTTIYLLSIECASDFDIGILLETQDKAHPGNGNAGDLECFSIDV